MSSSYRPIWHAYSLIVLLTMSSVVLPFTHAIEHAFEDIPQHQETTEHIHSAEDAFTTALPEVADHSFWCVYCHHTLLYMAAPQAVVAVPAVDARPLVLALGAEEQATFSQAPIRGPPSLLVAAA